jgi:hypothetical protein
MKQKPSFHANTEKLQNVVACGHVIMLASLELVKLKLPNFIIAHQ